MTGSTVTFAGVMTVAAVVFGYVALYSLAAAWLLIPYLLRRGHELGYYLVASFFMSMGTTELAHFAFPLWIDRPYGYFPGMFSVILLAPTAWWGLWRCATEWGAPSPASSA